MQIERILLKLKKDIEVADKQHNQLKGRRTELIKQLSEHCELGSADKVLDQYDTKIKELSTELNDVLVELEGRL